MAEEAGQGEGVQLRRPAHGGRQTAAGSPPRATASGIRPWRRRYSASSRAGSSWAAQSTARRSRPAASGRSNRRSAGANRAPRYKRPRRRWHARRRGGRLDQRQHAQVHVAAQADDLLAGRRPHLARQHVAQGNSRRCARRRSNQPSLSAGAIRRAMRPESSPRRRLPGPGTNGPRWPAHWSGRGFHGPAPRETAGPARRAGRPGR